MVANVKEAILAFQFETGLSAEGFSPRALLRLPDVALEWLQIFAIRRKPQASGTEI